MQLIRKHQNIRRKAKKTHRTAGRNWQIHNNCRTNNYKISEDVEYLNNNINQLDFIKLYRAALPQLHQNTHFFPVDIEY